MLTAGGETPGVNPPKRGPSEAQLVPTARKSLERANKRGGKIPPWATLAPPNGWEGAPQTPLGGPGKKPVKPKGEHTKGFFPQNPFLQRKFREFFPPSKNLLPGELTLSTKRPNKLPIWGQTINPRWRFGFWEFRKYCHRF